MSDTSNPPSIRDIAEIAGVSVATVSRVLNKKGKYSATTEKRVLAVVNSCGYISNMSAKSLREARSHTVGLIVPNVTNAFFSQPTPLKQSCSSAIIRCSSATAAPTPTRSGIISAPSSANAWTASCASAT